VVSPSVHQHLDAGGDRPFADCSSRTSRWPGIRSRRAECRTPSMLIRRSEADARGPLPAAHLAPGVEQADEPRCATVSTSPSTDSFGASAPDHLSSCDHQGHALDRAAVSTHTQRIWLPRRRGRQGQRCRAHLDQPSTLSRWCRRRQTPAASPRGRGGGHHAGDDVGTNVGSDHGHVNVNTRVDVEADLTGGKIEGSRSGREGIIEIGVASMPSSGGASWRCPRRRSHKRGSRDTPAAS